MISSSFFTGTTIDTRGKLESGIIISRTSEYGSLYLKYEINNILNNTKEVNTLYIPTALSMT